MSPESMQRVWRLRAVERSLSSWPRAISSCTDAGEVATGAGARQPSSVPARATPSQTQGEQRMIRLLLTTVATVVSESDRISPLGLGSCSYTPYPKHFYDSRNPSLLTRQQSGSPGSL